ncbi:MAG TPA: WGxxGxxG family protein [Bacillus sp. (in: firmicutes)]|nr:WGxxGxxG family protein [Bacillus sp. (in: firmicutes)]
MKKKLSSILCALTLTAIAFGMPVHAEDNNNVNRVYDDNGVTTRNVTTATGMEDDNDTNWEWIGLLGLVGLLGLRRREREVR